MNPVLSLPVLTAIGCLVTAIVGICAWKGSVGLPKWRRVGLLLLRVCGVATVFGLLANPGKWMNPSELIERPWLVLMDASESMNRETEEQMTRSEMVSGLVRQVLDHSKSSDIPVRLHPFSGSLESAVDAPGDASGTATKIVPTVSQALQDAASTGEPIAGVIVLSDGRQTEGTSAAEPDAIGLRARSRAVAVHTVVVGVDDSPPDLTLIQSRASLTAFAGQPLRVPFALRSVGLGPLRPEMVLRDADGGELAKLAIDVPPAATVMAAFELKAPAKTAQWTVETGVVEGEVRRANNFASVHVRIIDSKTRVFLAEGAPYWDSKFLAQLLRQQPHMDVSSVYRLSEQRYFHIDSGESDNRETDHPVFPASIEELARYDLVVFGKNVDPFLSGSRADMLRTYVRDHGGAVLFSRGRATTAVVDALEPLEPVVWSASGTGDFRFTPNRDGEAAGLFGEALPAPDASLWTSLPPLKDGRQVSMVKPFTRVLADGVPEATGLTGAGAMSGKFPALLVRRYGQGVSGMVNGDGLWKWDFYPEARELGNCYEDFWTQLIQWMASYSEFLPGQDFSLRLPAKRGQAGQTFSAAISYRGPEPVPEPRLEITGPDGSVSLVAPASLPDPSGRPVWRASFNPDRPGAWKLRIVDPRKDSPPTPEVLFSMPQPLGEDDDLSADPVLMEELAEATGGESLTPDQFAEFLDQHVVIEPPKDKDSGAVWQAGWNTAYTALVIALLLSSEWFIRRRSGLS